MWQDIFSEVESRSKDWSLPVTCGQPNNEAAVVLHLSRPQAFRHVLEEVQLKGDRYGAVSQPLGHRVLVNCAHMHSNNKQTNTLQHVRGLVLLQHIVNLLRVNGNTVAEIQPHRDHWDQEMLDSLNISSIYQEISEPPLEECSNVPPLHVSALLEASIGSSHRHLPQDVEEPVCGDKEDIAAYSPIVLDLKSYLDSDDFKQEEKKGFDKNLHFVDVCRTDGPTELLLQVSRLESCVATPQQNEREQPIKCCIHLVPCSQAYVQQQVHLTWQMLSQRSQSWDQSHVVFGSVTKRNNLEGQASIADAHDYVRLRKEQMEAAAIMKYGQVERGIEWDKMIQGLTDACVKFEMLSTNSKNQVKLDLLDTLGGAEGRTDNQGGPFVMYNCARLAMLFQNFTIAVKQGVYPTLPSLSQCDMTKLKLEEEWLLLYNFIEPYPSLVCSTVPIMGRKIQFNIHTHKITVFLVALSHCLSSYYSRVHVLGEPRPHLLPLMYARLHLLSAVHQVMRNGLQLLNIDPPSQL